MISYMRITSVALVAECQGKKRFFKNLEKIEDYTRTTRTEKVVFSFWAPAW
jgi:hypothetical protein